MLERLPYFKLHSADYLLDTLDLTHAEHGIYCLLMFTYYWQGFLPADRPQLYRLARASDELPQAMVEKILARFFHEANGRIFHNRIERELAGLSERVQHQSMAGKASAAARLKTPRPRKLKGNGQDKQSDVFTLPEWISTHPPLLAAWNAYLEMRKKIRKPATARAMIMACNKLENLRDQGQLPVAVLNQSVLKCWTDVYPLKE